MSFNTEKEAINFMEEKQELLFKNFTNLNLLAVVKDNKNSYKIESNIEVGLKGIYPIEIRKSLLNFSIELNSFFKKRFDINTSQKFVIKEGNSFTTMNGTNTYVNQTIRNSRNKEKGVLGCNFKLKGEKKTYLLTNQHVIGSLEDSSQDSIEALFDNPFRCYKKVAKYTDGTISNDADIAIAKYFEDNNIENKFPHLKVNTEKLDDYHIIKGKRNMLKSRKASVRITDEYFYSGKGKVLKDQILFSKYLFKGESGTVSLNEDKTKITGLFFASNNNYSVFNNIDIAFKRIINRGKLGKITLNDIEIINQF